MEIAPYWNRWNRHCRLTSDYAALIRPCTISIVHLYDLGGPQEEALLAAWMQCLNKMGVVNTPPIFGAANAWVRAII